MNKSEWLDTYLFSKADTGKDDRLKWGPWHYQISGKLRQEGGQEGFKI